MRELTAEERAQLETWRWGVSGVVRKYASARAALRRYFEALDAVLSASFLYEPERVQAENDPEERVIQIVDVGRCLRACSDEERYALELDVTRPDLPIAGRGRGGKRRGFTTQDGETKCALMALRFGGRYWPRKFDGIVREGESVVAAALARAELIELVSGEAPPPVAGLDVPDVMADLHEWKEAA